MARLTNAQRIISLQTRGKFGRPSSFGHALCGYNSLGTDDSLVGIYQKATFRKGRDIQILRVYFPKNPRSVAQTARRDLFKAGVVAYRALTSPERAIIDAKGRARRMTGYNYFLSRWLRGM